MSFAAIALAGLLGAGVVIAGRMGHAHSPADYEKQIKPLLSQYCYGCHNEEKHKGGLSLQAYPEITAIHQRRDVWAEVLRKVRGKEMPPEGKPQPSPTQRDRIANWIEAELFPVDPAHPDPGRVTIRRLNRAEYNNTIRDLIGIDFHPADDFPNDDTGYGFDNIGDVLTVSPLLLEKYLAAAEKILDEAIVDEFSRPPARKFFPATEFKCQSGGSLMSPAVFCLSSEGEVVVTNKIAQSGQYRWRVLAYAEPAGPEKATMGLRLDGKTVETCEVRTEENSPAFYEMSLRLESGPHKFSSAFLNDYYNPSDPDPKNRDRNLYVESMELVGPLDSKPPPLPESHRRIFVKQPTAGTTNQCLKEILGRFALRAFRRPPSAAEIDRLAGLAQQALQDGASFERSVRVALEAVLVSPHFLFRGELQPQPNNAHRVHRIDEYALASRLSYFLWSSMPDDELFALAEKGKLRKNLDAQVARMLRDSKSEALVQNFAGQWLQLRNLKLVAPDPKIFPDFDESLRVAMRTETELFFANIIRQDRSILDFLTADYTFANERLASFYKLPGVSGTEFRKVSLQGTPRRGVLTQASVLTVTSNPTRTSPVKRGKWVLDNLLAQPPPPPLPNVPPLSEAKEDVAAATLRQRMERHRQDPICASCHAQMDPIGFSLEHFDGIGAWRDKEGAFPIDDSGQLKSGERFSGAEGLTEILAHQKRNDFVRCLTEKLLTYALGRGLEYYDRPAVDRIMKDLARKDYRFSALVLEVAMSAPFELRRGEGGEVISYKF